MITIDNINYDTEGFPNHIAIIMDGNRRWARAKGLPATAGHKQGAKTLEKILVFCNKLGIRTPNCLRFLNRKLEKK